MNDFFSTIRHRHSVRHYQTDMPVENEKLQAILESAVAAPSAGDMQAYQVGILEDVKRRSELAKITGQGFITEAPICLVFCTDIERSAIAFGTRGRELYALQDATIAAAYAQLAAVAAGLGSAWVGYFNESEVNHLLDLPTGLNAVALLTLGYAAERPESSSRRRMDDMIFHI